MRFGLKWLVVFVLVAALMADGRAGVLRPASQPDNTISSGPYKAILDRNVFDLRDPPIVQPPLLKVASLPNVKLVGLMILSGIPQAVLAISEPDTVGKPPTSCILSENQRQLGVEVKEINYTAKTAKVIMGENGENVAVLKLEEPKQMAPGGIMVGGPGGVPGGGRPYPPNRPGFTPSQAPQIPGAYNTGAYNPGAGTDAGAGAGFGGGGGMGESSIPNRPVRTEPQMSPEQQMYNMEAQRQAALQANSPIAQLIPITTITSQQDIEATKAQAAGVNPTQQPQNPNVTGPGGPGNTTPTTQQPFGQRFTGSGNTLVPGGK